MAPQKRYKKDESKLTPFPTFLNSQASSSDHPNFSNQTIIISSFDQNTKPNMSAQNQSPLQQPTSPTPQSVHSGTSQDRSPQFFPSPPSSQLLWNSPDSHNQTHAHLGHDEQSAVPLLHHETGLPITVFIDPLMTPPPMSHPVLDNQLESQPHPDLIPVAQSSSTEHRHQQSPSSIVQKVSLPELSLHLLPQVEDEFDTERLEQVVERLRDANNSWSARARHHAENSNATAAGTGIGDVTTYTPNTVTNGVPSSEDKDGAGPSLIERKEERANQEHNYEDEIGGSERARQTMEKANTQRCSGNTVGIQNPTNENCLSSETEKEEHVLIEEDEAHRHEQSGLTEQQNGIGADEEIIAEVFGVVDDGESQYDPSAAQDQSDEPPATSDRDRSRRRGRKRSRGDMETGYWLRSRKPPSSSKRSRRTHYWLRP